MKKTLVSAILAGTLVFGLAGLSAAAEQVTEVPGQETETGAETEIESELAQDTLQSGKEAAKKLVGAVNSLLGEVIDGQEETAETEAETAAPETEVETAETAEEETETEFVFADWNADAPAIMYSRASL